MGTLGSEQAFHDGQAWAHPVLWTHLLPGTICLEPPLLDLRPYTRSLKVTLRASGKASSGASSVGSVAAWPLQYQGPVSAGQVAGWNFLESRGSPSCLLTGTAAFPVTERCVPQCLVSESHSERAASPAAPWALPRGAVGEHSLELGGMGSLGPGERDERGSASMPPRQHTPPPELSVGS